MTDPVYTLEQEYPEMSRHEPHYDVICNEKVIAEFAGDGNWSMCKGAILKLDSDEHGTAFFQVERVVYAWTQQGFFTEGDLPDGPENEGILFVRPYMKDLQIGIV